MLSKIVHLKHDNNLLKYYLLLKFDCLILEAGSTELRQAVIYNACKFYAATLADFLNPNIWPSNLRIGLLKEPMLHISASGDPVVEHKDSLTLYRLAHMSVYKEFYASPFDVHETLYKYDKEVMNRVKNFLKKIS